MKKLWLVMWVGMYLMVAGARAVEPGQAAPDFKALSTAGREVSLADFAGDWLVIYFYPKSFTPGCTAESCSLRDGYAGIQALGARILGVSLDSLETQQKFKAEYNLPFDLLSDEHGEMAKAYDALGFGGFMAKRVTYIINPQGVVAKVLDEVKTGDHDTQVAAALREAQQAAQP